MKDQLPAQLKSIETGSINLHDAFGPGTRWVALAIDPRADVYFEPYGLAPPNEFMPYIQRLKTPHKVRTWYSTLQTEQLNYSPI